MATLTIVAGPNGSGKSTLTRWNREVLQDTVILDPDAIAKALQAETGASNQMDAGRLVLEKAAYLLQTNQSFLVETTLSGNTYLRMAQQAKAAGYTVEFFFVGTNSIDVNLARVKQRVLRGGHDIPEEDQRRRYPRCFLNLQKLIPPSDRATLYDNSTLAGYTQVAVKSGGVITLHEALPHWAEFLRTPSHAPDSSTHV